LADPIGREARYRAGLRLDL